MKLTIVNNDNRLARRCPRARIVKDLSALGFHDDLVIDAKFAFGHAAQVGLHEYATGDVCRQHLSLGRHEQVDVLQHVEEQLVTTILYAFATPADLAGDLGRDLHLLLLTLRLDAHLRNERLEYARVAVLRIPKVEYLVEQLVDEHKVVLDVLLVDLAEVRLHDLREPYEKLEYHGTVDVLLSDGGQPNVGPADVKERSARDVGDRRADLLARVYDVHAERVHGVAADVIAVHPRYQHFALVVVHEQTADHGDVCGCLVSGRSSKIVKVLLK